MINPIIKIVLRPVVRAIDALLEKLHLQIMNGEKDEALKTVSELRNAVKEAAKYLN